MRVKVALTSAAALMITLLASYDGKAGAAPVVTKPLAVAAPNCGGAAPLKPDGSRWTCTFHDEFFGGQLDSNKWVVQTTAGSGFATSDTCYVNNANNVRVANGWLNLVARTEWMPQACSWGTASWKTKHTGGAVVSWGKFSQTGGRFEFRAKFPATTKAGFWGNLWLYPQAPTYGKGEASGEIDVAEHWSGHGDKVFPSLHYTGDTSADTATNCTVARVSSFHTYRVEWSTRTMRFYYDDKLCLERTWAPVGLVNPKPFDQPFVIVMSEGHGDPYYPVSPSLPTQGPVAVDWVRVYR